MRSCHVLGYILVLFLSPFVNVAESALAAIAIDYGSEYVKIALVKPGVPMEIVLNRESHRKTLNLITIRKGERFFSDSGANQALKVPNVAYAFLNDLMGKKVAHPLVKLYQTRFPDLQVVPHEDRGTAVLKSDGDVSYSVEELVAMIFSECRALAEVYADQPIKDVVVTVPPFASQAERRAFVAAADIAGFNLLQLMNDNTAAGLNYGVFRRKLFNETAQYMMILDMGASKTTATVVSYRMVRDKVSRELHPEMTVHGVGFDRTLGGIEITLRLRDHLAKAFMAQGKAKKDVFKNPKAMAKLRKEAERVKKVLSANPDIVSQVEHLAEDLDFKVKVTRAELEAMVEDLWPRLDLVVNDAMRMAELEDFGLLDSVALMGGGTRMPKLQERLMAVTKKSELGKFLNTDEAAALGAVYQAAHLSQGFKVKKFGIKDINLYPIRVDFMKENSSSSESPEGRTVQRTLFTRRNPFPQKKVMTFSKHTADFDLRVNYGDLSAYTLEQIKELGPLNLTRAEVSGVSTAIFTHMVDGVMYKGVKVHFRMDDSGLLNLDNAEIVFERNDTDDSVVSSTLSKIGAKLSSFFGGSDEKKGAEKADEKSGENSETNSDSAEKEPEKPAEQDAKSGKGEDFKPDPETPEGAQPPTATPPPEPATDGAKNATNQTATNTTVKAAPKPPKITRERLPVKQECMDVANLTTEALTASRKMLKQFADAEKAKADREIAINELESFTIDMGMKLEEDEFIELTSEEERESLKSKVKADAAWLEDEAGFETETKEYVDRLSKLKEAFKDLFFKLDEAKERPKVYDAVKSMLNYSNVFLTSARGMSEDEQVFTDVEMNTLEKVMNETKTWWEQKAAEQEALQPHQMPTLTVKNVAEKLHILEREVKYLLGKAKYAKPLKKKAEEEKNKTAETAKKEESATDAPKGEETQEQKPDVETAEETTEDGSKDKGTSEEPTKEEKTADSGEKHEDEDDHEEL